MSNGEAERTIEVVSPEFPCGSAWLANCLFELGVASWHLWGFDTRHEWTHCGSGRYRYIAGDGPWRQTLASLRPGAEFVFDESIVTRFSHEFAWHRTPARQVVLMVRDPRDALYSEWQRHRTNLGLPGLVQFPEFIASPFFGGPVSMADALWLHLKGWLSYRMAMPARVLVVRFEDWKREPVAALRRICKFMRLDRDDATLERASAASDVRRLQAIESGIAASTSNVRRFNRRGEPYEWRSAWHESWFQHLGRRWMSVLDALDYPRHDAHVAADSMDLTTALQWAGLLDPERIRIWQRLLDAPLRLTVPATALAPVTF